MKFHGFKLHISIRVNRYIIPVGRKSKLLRIRIDPIVHKDLQLSPVHQNMNGEMPVFTRSTGLPQQGFLIDIIADIFVGDLEFDLRSRSRAQVKFNSQFKLLGTKPG